MFKYLSLFFLVIAMLFILSCGSKDSFKKTPPQSDSTITFTGQGIDTTDNFNCNGGLVKFALTHDGESNYIVHLRDTQTGDITAFLVNAVGVFDGTVADNPPAATYLIEVNADGKWTVDITGDVAL